MFVGSTRASGEYTGNMDNHISFCEFYEAVENGNEAVAHSLLERGNIDVNAADSSGLTPLCYAAAQGNEVIVRLLLKRGDIDVNAADDRGQTPLWWAAFRGRKAIVYLLRERGDIDVNAADYSGRTPLSLAAGFDSFDSHVVVCLLLERDDTDVNAADSSGRTPLFWAAFSGNGTIVRLLFMKTFTAAAELQLAEKDPNFSEKGLKLLRDLSDRKTKGCYT